MGENIENLDNEIEFKHNKFNFLAYKIKILNGENDKQMEQNNLSKIFIEKDRVMKRLLRTLKKHGELK